MTKGYHNYRGRGGRQKRLLAVVLVLFAANQADFFTVYGPQSIFNQVITLCIAALGQTVIVLTSGIDLSVGNLIIFTNCVAATIYMPVTNALGGSIVVGGAATIVIVLLVGVQAVIEWLICGVVASAVTLPVRKYLKLN